MAGIDSPLATLQCTICGFRQTSGQSEDILFCPECGSTSWVAVEGGSDDV